MSAREFLINHLWAGRVTVPRATEMVDGYRAAVLAEDGQAYNGELAMYRGLVATLRAVAKHGGIDDVRKVLAEHAADEAVALLETREKSSPARADATPREAARERRLEQLLDTIRTHGGKWSTGSLQTLRRETGGPVQRGTARRDLAELHRRGHLAQHGAGDGRYYTLRTKDGRS